MLLETSSALWFHVLRQQPGERDREADTQKRDRHRTLAMPCLLCEVCKLAPRLPRRVTVGAVRSH